MVELDPKQFSRPTGKDGRNVLEDMNVHHRPLAEWALSVLPDIDPKTILDIGCGGGMLISILGQMYPKSKINGVDISDESITLAKEVNADIISKGKCEITLASVSDLPFNDGTFDLVTAFETYFFWPDLENDIEEASRTVRSGGHMLIVSETYPHPDFDERNAKLIVDYGLNILDNRDMAELLERNGFVVEIAEIEKSNWVAFLGKKI